MLRENEQKQIDWLSDVIDYLESMRAKMETHRSYLEDADLSITDSLPEFDGRSETRVIIDLKFKE